MLASIQKNKLSANETTSSLTSNYMITTILKRKMLLSNKNDSLSSGLYWFSLFQKAENCRHLPLK